MAAGGTHADGAVAAAVEQQNGLPARADIFGDRTRQRHADHRLATVEIFVVHIDKLHRRHNGIAVAVVQRVVAVLAALRHVVGLNRRRSGA